MTNYFVVYKPDSSKNFFFSIDKEWKWADEETDGKLLDHIFQLEDGDLANYEIYLRII